jgi:hypothetical protein
VEEIEDLSTGARDGSVLVGFSRRINLALVCVGRFSYDILGDTTRVSL